MTATVTAVQVTTRVRAFPIELNFFAATPMPLMNATASYSFQIQYVPDTMSEAIIFFLLTVSVIFAILIWFRYRRHTTEKVLSILIVHRLQQWYLFNMDTFICIGSFLVHVSGKIYVCSVVFFSRVKIDWSSLRIWWSKNETHQLQRSLKLMGLKIVV